MISTLTVMNQDSHQTPILGSSPSDPQMHPSLSLCVSDTTASQPTLNMKDYHAVTVPPQITLLVLDKMIVWAVAGRKGGRE